MSTYQNIALDIQKINSYVIIKDSLQGTFVLRSPCFWDGALRHCPMLRDIVVVSSPRVKMSFFSDTF